MRHIRHFESDGNGIIEPAVRLVDADGHVWFFISTEFVIFHADLTVMVIFISAAFVLTDTYRLNVIA